MFICVNGICYFRWSCFVCLIYEGKFSRAMGWWFSILLLCSIRDVRC